MIDYSTIANTVGAFPNVVSQNATAPGATDGTPYLKSVIDDLWGARQALMDTASLTPTGVTESPAASQFVEAVQKVSGVPGVVVAWMGDAADPSVSGIRLLPLNGQGVLRASYPELDAATYVGDPQNPTASAFYHADDAGGTIRNTAGIYLILPDGRGNTIRGLDTGAIRDPQGAGRDIGNQQDHAMDSHEHRVGDLLASADTDHYESTDDSPSVVPEKSYDSSLPNTETNRLRAFAANITQTNISTENRMYNITARWVIRY